jgi:uncharacterized protein YuzE
MAIDSKEIRKVLRDPMELPPVVDSYFDEEADVLYVRFERGVEDDSVLTPDDVVMRYRERRLLSITILHASKRPGPHLSP